MSKLFILVSVVLLSGCGTHWQEQSKPITPQERDCVQITTKAYLGQNPSTLAGHDQDWDDAISAAHFAAVKSCCKPRLYEIDSYSQRWTGKYKEIQ